MTQEIIDSAKIIADNLKERKCCFVTVVNGYTIYFIREELKKLIDKPFVTYKGRNGKYMFKMDVLDLGYYFNGTMYG